MGRTTEVTANVREIKHRVHVDLADAPPITTAFSNRRRPAALLLEYGIGRDVQRVDVAVQWRNGHREHFPPDGDMPGWMRRIVEDNLPRDVDSPDANRRTGMGGWPVPAPESVAPADGDGTPGICWCSRAKEPGENHSMCYPGME